MTPRKQPDEMTHTEYLTLIYRLGLTPCSKRASLYLGLSVRQLHRISSRNSPIPRPVALLLSLYDQILSQNKAPTMKEVEAMAKPPSHGLYRANSVWQRSAPRGPSRIKHDRGWKSRRKAKQDYAQIKHDLETGPRRP